MTSQELRTGLLHHSNSDLQSHFKHEKAKTVLESSCWVLLLPLKCLISPCIMCFDAQCWENYSVYHRDVAIQSYGIFQVIIAALWSSLFSSILTSFEVSNNIKDETYLDNIIITLLYDIILYCLISLLVLTLANQFDVSNSQIETKFSFIIGILAHVTAFGFRDLAFYLATAYFSKTLWLSIVFFIVLFLFSLLFIAILPYIRKHLWCYCDCYFNCCNIYHKDKSRHRRLTSVSTHHSQLHELNGNDQRDHENDHHTSMIEHNFEMWLEKMNEIDNDAFMVSLGFIFVEIVLYFESNEWISIKSASSVSDAADTSDYTGFVSLILIAIIIIFWILWTHFISFLQATKDRLLHFIFDLSAKRQNQNMNNNTLQNKPKLNDFELETKRSSIRSIVSGDLYESLRLLTAHGDCDDIGDLKNSNNNNNNNNKNNGNNEIFQNKHQQEQDTHDNYEYNCCTKCVIGFFIKYNDDINNILIFADCLMGWALGWVIATNFILIENLISKLIWTIVNTVGLLVLYIFRLYLLRRRLLIWKKKVNLYDSSDYDNGMEINNDQLVVIPEQTRFKEQKLLYFLNHSKYFFVRTFSLAIGLPWESFVDVLVETLFENENDSQVLSIKTVITLVLIIVLTYCGLRFVQIENKFDSQSTSQMMQRYFQGYSSNIIKINNPKSKSTI